MIRVKEIFFGFVFAAFVSGCAASSSSAQPVALAVDPDPTVIPTAELPSISVYELIDGEPVPVVEGAAGNVAVLDDSGLPAPVVSGTDGSPSTGQAEDLAGEMPTAFPTDPPPTPTNTPIPPTPIPDNTPTPVPTFTIPALPNTSDEAHYWMIRPIPEGGIVWTDKSYSYGSTKGNSLRTHHGVEFFVTYDTQVLATADGTVIMAGWDDGENIMGPEPDFYGNVVVIEHDFLWRDEKIYTLYGHLNSISVTKGQRVKQGDLVGLSGASGVADGAHLHFEVRQGSNDYLSTRNPLLWLWPFPEDGTLAGKVTFESGGLAYAAPVNFRRLDGDDRTVYLATSYADDGVNGDTVWQENYAADDVDAGFYEVYVKVNNKKYAQEVWVYPRRTTFVDIVIPNP